MTRKIDLSILPTVDFFLNSGIQPFLISSSYGLHDHRLYFTTGFIIQSFNFNAFIPLGVMTLGHRPYAHTRTV